MSPMQCNYFVFTSGIRRSQTRKVNYLWGVVSTDEGRLKTSVRLSLSCAAEEKRKGGLAGLDLPSQPMDREPVVLVAKVPPGVVHGVPAANRAFQVLSPESAGEPP